MKLDFSGNIFPNEAQSNIISAMSDSLDATDKNRVISLPEAAELYGFNPRYVAELARKGRLKARKVGKFWITTPNDFEIYLESRKKKGMYRDDITPIDS